MKPNRDLVRRINAAYDYLALLKHFTGREFYRAAIPCPFHDDITPSAKVFSDKNGDKLHCFTEGRQFTITDYLEKMGEDLKDWDPGGKTPRETLDSAYDFSPLDVFKRGKCDINQFLTELLNLRRLDESNKQ